MHGGCGFERAERFANEYDSYVQAAAKLVAIGEGEPPRAKEYAAETDRKCPMVCDPGRGAYPADGLRDLRPAEVLHGACDAYVDFDPDAGQELAEERRERGDPFVDNGSNPERSSLIPTDRVN